MSRESAPPGRAPEQPGSQPAAKRLARARSPGPPYLATAAILLGSVVVSQLLPGAKRAFGGNVPPLFARLSPSVGLGIVLPIALLVVVWVALPVLLPARILPFLLAVVAFAWVFSVALAAQSGGLDAVTAPLRGPLDYYANVPLVDALGPRAFAERYPDLTDQLSLHATTHPPGAALMLWAVSKLVRGNVLAVALAVVLVGAAGSIPAYWLARHLYGEAAARLAVLLFAVSPGVLLYSATSLDAVFMTVTAVAMAAAVRAPSSDGWAATTGALTALALSFTFGAAAVGVVALGVGALAMRTTRAGTLVRRAALACGGLIAAALVLRWLVGIDLVGTLRSALDARVADPAWRDRPFAYWVVANVPAFLLAAGIAQTALLADETGRRWRARRPGVESVLWGSLLLASLSGMFKGEVDHIWLMFVPLLVAVGGAALARNAGSDAEPLPPHQILRPPATPRVVRAVIVASLVNAILMEVLLFTFW